MSVVNALKSRFDVHVAKSTHRGTGYPWGSWCLWFSVWEWVARRLRVKGARQYDWVFAFEADCSPAQPQWIEAIDREVCAAPKDAMVLGSVVYHHQMHINGNLVVRPDVRFFNWLLRGVTVAGVPPKAAWDLYLFPEFVKQGVCGLRAIRNACALPTTPPGYLDFCKQEGVFFVHGIKDESLKQVFRERYVRTAVAGASVLGR
jgi:hypothetical protein